MSSTHRPVRPRNVSMGFVSEHFPAGTHMCYIYNDEQERRQVMSRFLESGLQEGEKVGYFADTPVPAELDDFLIQMGMRLPEHLRAGQFALTRAQDTYCPDGHFLPARMLDTLRTAYDTSIREGYSGARASGEMTWALRGLPGSERLIEYEALINTVVGEHPITAVCQYDANRFDGATLFDVLSVHPAMIVRGQIVRNPYYIPPEEFLPRRQHSR